MSDDFERAVLIIFAAPGSVEPILKERATTFISDIKQNSECWRLCTERFSVTPYPDVKFWCLQTLHEIVRTVYPSLDSNIKAAVKSALLTWVQRDCAMQPPLPVFLRNKVAQVVVAIVQLEYPQEWPSFFHDLNASLSQGPGMADMFCRILVAVDEDVISLEIPRSQEESRLSMHLKDSMREGCISQIAEGWYALAAAYKQTQPELTAFVLSTMQRYINWMDISLVANKKFVPLLLELMEHSSPDVRGAALDCVNEVLSKRMEPVAKLALVQQLGIADLCATWTAAAPSGGGGEDDELLMKCARLLATLAAEIMDSLKRVENGVISIAAVGFAVDAEAAEEAQSAQAAATKLLAQLLPAILNAFKSEVDEVALPLLPFITAYIARLKTLTKRSSVLPPEAGPNIQAILEGITLAARYPADSANSAMSGEVGAAARDEMTKVEEKRRGSGGDAPGLFTLFKNVAKIALPEVLGFVGSMLQRLMRLRDAAWQDVEVAVMLLYELGEGASEEMQKPGCGMLGQLALALAQGSVPAAQHRLVALAVMECYVRFAKVLQQQQQCLPTVVKTFLDERGVDHPSEDVSTRACYQFQRLVRALKQNLRPYTGGIVQSLRPQLARIARTPPADGAPPSVRPGATESPKASVDDRIYLFEAVGVLVGQDDLDVGEREAMLSSLLQPLLQQVEENMRGLAGQSGTSGSAPLILQALDAIARLSKGFRTEQVTRHQPQIGRMFIATLEVAVGVVKVLPANRAMRTRFISFVHRMVELLMHSLLQYLPTALEVLMHTQADAVDMGEVLGLLTQLIQRFKESLQKLLEAVLPVVVLRVHSLLRADWDWSGKLAAPGAMAGGEDLQVAATVEEAREKGELQRLYYSLIHSMAHSGLSSVLLRLQPEALEAVMGALQRGAATHVDAACRRTCLQVFLRLLTEWSTTNGEAVPGFKRFAMDHVGAQVCVLGLMSGTLDARDASTVALLGEAATAMKLVYEKCGDEFPARLCAVVLPTAGVPAELQQQLISHLREADTKLLKDDLRCLVLQASGGGGKS